MLFRSRLTNWKIDIKSESQIRELIAKAQEDAENEDIVEEIDNNEEE